MKAWTFRVLLASALACLAGVAVGETTWTFAYSHADDFSTQDGIWSCSDVTSVLLNCRSMVKSGRVSSGVFRGRLSVDRPGRWAFRLNTRLPKGLGGENQQVNCGEYRTFVNGVSVSEQPGGEVELSAGPALVEVFYRKRRMSEWGLYAFGFTLEARAPGATDFVPVWPAACSDEEARRPFIAFGREFSYDEGRTRAQTFREFDYEAPEEGLYEIAVHHGRIAGSVRELHVDGCEIFYADSHRPGSTGPEWLYGDVTNRRYAVRRDFFGRIRRVVHLTKGRHVIGIGVRRGMSWDDVLKDLMRGTNAQLRCGVTRMTSRTPASGTCLFPEGRDNLVFRAGERLRVRAQRPQGSPSARYRLEVQPLGEERIAFSQALEVDGDARWLEYPCEKEGGYEYVVRGSDGAVVEGPWEFVVVDVRGASAKRQQTSERVLADEVRCDEGAGAAHCFRDSGHSSRVVTNAAGVVYREVGPRGQSRAVYARTKAKGIRPLVQGEERRGKKRPALGTRDFESFDWFAYTLRVRHPGRAHVVRCTVPNDLRRLVAVYAIDWKTCLNAGWNVETGDAPSAGKTGEMSFVIWPTGEAVDVVVMHPGRNGPLLKCSAVASIRLEECPDGLPPLEIPAAGWAAGREFGWTGEQGNLHVMERMWPDFIGDGRWIGTGYGIRHRSWADFLTAWNRFGEFSRHRGDTLVSVPSDTYNQLFLAGEPARLLMPGNDVYSGELYEQSVPAPNNDLFFRDVFALELLIAEKYGVRLVADFMTICSQSSAETWCQSCGWQGSREGVYLTDDAAGKLSRGKFGYLIPNPAHPAVRARLIDFNRALGRRYGRYPAFAGVRHRFWKNGGSVFEPSFCKADAGFDDFTVSRFLSEDGPKAGVAERVGKNQAAFEVRRKLLLSSYGEAWNAWRTKTVLSLNEEMLAALREGAPKAQFYGPVTDPKSTTGDDGWHASVGLDPKVFAGRCDLGFDEGYCRMTGSGVEVPVEFDPTNACNFSVRPEPYTNCNPFAVVPWKYFPYPSGISCNSSYRISPYHLERPALALADNRLTRLCAGPEWCLPPTDEPLRRFVRVWRTIPVLDYRRVSLPSANVQVWSASTASNTVVFAVNRTDVRQAVEIVLDGPSDVEEPVSGAVCAKTRTAQMVLEPFMPAVRFVRTPDAVTEVRHLATDDERAFVSRELAFLESVGQRAVAAKTNGTTFAMSFASVEKARRTGDIAAIGAAIRAFECDQTNDFFFEQGGWPESHARFDFLWYWVSGSAFARRYRTVMANPDELVLKRFAFRNGEDFVCVPSGRKGLLRIGSSKERRYLCLSAIFGEGYGPVRVLCDGKQVGRIPAGRAKGLRLESRFVVIPPQTTAKNVLLELVPEGPGGLALYQLQVRETPPLD